jgi:hypothetical protein
VQLNFEEMMKTLSDEQKLHFYELFAHNMTVGIRGIWSEADIGDSEKVELMKWANEVLHHITAKVWVLRLKTHVWTESDFGKMLEEYKQMHPGISGAIDAAMQWSYQSAIGKE